MGPLIRAALLLAVAFPAAAQDGHRTKRQWLAAGSAARADRLLECEDDEREARKPDCANVRAAEDEARRRRRGRGVPTADQVLSDPDYWAGNPVARAAALGGCNRGTSGLTARECAAARAGR